ncbi:unnamed protein product [Rotaria magnacalcarata]|uniref:Uncharacterized protein n=1 Tax=Rotaria magnacalcarata TaxID=392030 RepID=A0A816YYF1_9BILA|nr:unnamed protein product [Rotaria magnacalcarata]CAF2190897.1 unnamed protein product [Rotaria magnacalcarata]CAF3736685.1 unnamed protein product [Rotaria magnacalcarata]CAF3991350.1 unnamed protein product [Rotaria magnacalcarata]
MIDPRFANAGAISLAPEYGAQAASIHHRRHHRHHRKNKHGLIDESPLSRDESIHKVDRGHHQVQQSAPIGAGYGVPYGVGGIYPQQKYPGSHYGLANQYRGNAYDQSQFGVATVTKHHRRHHRHPHRKHAVEATDNQSQAIPEVLIGQRSSSVLSNEAPQERQGRSSVSPVADETTEMQATQRESRRQHSGENFSSGRIYHSRQVQGQVSGGSEGYGHIDKDLIFIERGENSPHRQKPPRGYEFKGKIEVQCMEKETRSRSRGRTSDNLPPVPQPMPLPTPSVGPCPPGWQQVMMSAASCGPCPPGSNAYTAQVVGGAGMAQAGFGGVGMIQAGYGGAAGSYGGSASGNGLANLAASLPFSSQGQLIADYIVESTAAGGDGANSSGGSGSGAAFEAYSEHREERITGRAKIIEVWQKRSRSEVRKESRSRSHSHGSHRSGGRSPKQHITFNFEKFRSEILIAIERIMQTGGNKPNTGGQSGGTQTSIHTIYPNEKEKEKIQPHSCGGGEVRVIVQPIQPVFYMPRQTEQTTTTGPAPVPHVGPAPAIQQATTVAPQIVYVPRNVYVPVIKPVFVPRERVIVRPQIIHVARPVLVDRPVPVTQRPIIIDRERPIPVPIRTPAAAAQGGSKVIREEYVYRDNLPVAYGGRCSEYAGGVNYGYMPTQQEHQYATSSVHEVSNGYQAQGPVINVTVPNQFQHSQSGGQLNVQQGGGSFHESFTNAGQVNNGSALNGLSLDSTAPIEVLDTTVNPTWQRTDKATLVRRFGRTAFDIVQKTDQVEQKMYQELRQRNSSGGVQRSYSAASYGSGSGVENGNAGGFSVNNASFSSFPIGNINCD